MRGIFGGLTGALLREQWRAQRRYTLTAGVLVTLAVALATFAAASWATREAADAVVWEAFGYDREHSAEFSLWTDGQGFLDGEPWDGGWHDTTPEALASAVEEAEALGVDPLTMLSTDVRIRGFDSVVFVESPVSGIPQTLLYQGASPASGQIALPATLAEELEVDIGDALTLTGLARDGVPAAEPVSVEVSGLTRVDPDPYWREPMLFAAPEDMPTLARLSIQAMVSEDGTRTAPYYAQVRWDGADVPALSDAEWGTDETSGFVWDVPTSVNLAVGGAILLAVTAVAAALAAGRAQGEERTRWVATARALGATREDLLRAAALEGVVRGLAAGAAGLAIGWAAATVPVAGTHLASDPLYGPSVAVLPWPLVPVLLSLAVVIALVISLAPARWATRVEPSAALKPTGPLDLRTERAGRKASPAALAVTCLAALAVASADALTLLPESRLWELTVNTAWLVAAGAAIALAIVALRAAVTPMARLLEATRRPSLLLAADSLRHRTGGTFPAATALLLSAPLTVFAAQTAITVPSDGDAAVATWDRVVSELLPWWLGGAVLIAAGGLVVGLAEWMGRGRALREAATTGALGLDRHGRQIAAIARVAAPMTLGLLAGAALGLSASALLEAMEALAPGPGVPSWETLTVESGRSLVAALGIVAAGAVGVGVAALFAARGVDARSPQEAARLAR
ncbi:FtsX-like permease family protein [Demequina mangrovi]|uniref:FtsX-like permease family protein n=1 Tax=Demequina mangrovi TaxID=1043493 RepID=A0A1H7ABL7_9MICO|nr:FtsX-like permease family protein [Demequina mangrovi]SEJ61914.1 FtsX-like permease family protein [Demequina mangrovi]